MTDVDRTGREWRWWHKFSQPAFLSKFCKGALFGHSLYFFCKGHSLWSCVTATDVERPGGQTMFLAFHFPWRLSLRICGILVQCDFVLNFVFGWWIECAKEAYIQRDPALRTRHTRIARADMSRKADLMRTEMIHRLKIFCHKLFIQNRFIKSFHFWLF
jgi:hypothetical protein